MSEIVNGATAQAPKVTRRGITNATRSTSRLSFHEQDAAKNGLFIAALNKVSVEWSTGSEDSKSFAGIATPRLSCEFCSMHENASERRYVNLNINVVESSVDTIEGGSKAWRVNSVFAWIKHLLEVYYLKGREFTEAEEDALQLGFCDTDAEGNYEPVEPEVVAKGYQVLFENASAMLNGSFNLPEGKIAKPCYKTADGKLMPVWIKLLRYHKINNQWKAVLGGKNSGDLGFEGFVGTGAIEIMQPNTAPKVLKLDLSKESITPKEVSTPTIGGAGSAPIANMAAPAFNNFDNNAAYQQAGVGEDGMPF